MCGKKYYNVTMPHNSELSLIYSQNVKLADPRSSRAGSAPGHVTASLTALRITGLGSPSQFTRLTHQPTQKVQL